ncbi:MAG: ExeM/NucH family extracellular endonuclease [Acidobacteria bacterium]|nr:ExeM/NucH family extracellular endonuclease [Acidobacteriota bacterium]
MRPTQNHLTRYFSLIRLSSFLRARSMMAAIVLLPALAFAVYYLVSPPAARGLSTSVVISQVYGAGGLTGASLRNDYVELFNRGTSSVSLTGWSVQYASASGTGNFSANPIATLSGTLAPGQYYLVQLNSAGAVGALLPTADATGTVNMSGTAGKVALVNSTTGLACNGGSTVCNASQLAQIIDLVGYGTTANFSRNGSAPAPPPGNTTAIFRNNNGCTESDNNSTDFTTAATAPRNTSSTFNPCSSADAAPAVLSDAVNNASGVALSSNISITFTEAVTAGSAAFTISCTNSSGHPFVLNGGPTTYILDPSTNFTANEVCTVTVTAAQVTDQDVNDPPDLMAMDYIFSFTTDASGVCGDPATLISAVQGSGTTSPLVGNVVTVEAIVTGDYQGTGQFGGYYLQEEDANADGNPATSEGIFVFNTAFPVNVGDKVRVTGTVAEFLSSGQTLTQLSTVSSVQVCSTGNVLPAATTVNLPVSSVGEWERYEGMLINIPQNLTVTETFTLGRFGELTLSVNGRLSTPTNIVAPGAPAIAQQALNDRSSIVLDDANNLQNIDPTIYPAGGLSALNTLRSGYTVNGLTGVLEQRFGVYRIQPVGSISFTASNPRQAAPDAVGGALKVASFNVLNYFNGNGLGGGFPTSRGANSVTEFNRQRSKIISAIVALNADIVGLMEIENDAAGNSAIEDLVSGLNAATASGTYTFINTGVVGTDEIRVALIYKPANVAPVGAYKILDSSVNSNFIDTLNRPSLAQTFALNSNGARLTVVVNHLKSKGSNCNSVGDPDIGDGQDNCNLTRTKAATALVNWLATDPTGSGDPDFIIIGDMNAYAKEDPITAIKNGGYTDLINSVIGANAYSYVFSGGAGYIDHALASSALVPQVAGITEWHINADEPTVLDYNVEFKSANHVNTLFDSGPFRASDHDPVLIGLNLNAPPTISAVGAMQQQGSPSANSTIANVNDVDQAENTLSVKVNGGTSATVNGVTVSNITVDAAGVVKADIVASCNATNAAFTLRVTDSYGLFAETTLNVTVTANTAPTVGNYAATNLLTGGGTTVTPSAAPADNGTIAMVTATASPNTFTGSLVGNTTTGAITISNAAPAGTYTITVTVKDNCGAETQKTFSLKVNTPPTIGAVATSRQQGSPSANSTIANVNDVDQAANTLSVTVNGGTSATVNGVTVSNIAVSAAGVVTADVVATCTATNASFTLRVTDSLGDFAEATLNVTVSANTAPVLSYAALQNVIGGNGLTVNPATGPSDNGSVSTIIVQSKGTFTGTVAVNAAGVVTISNAAPLGSHTITIRATDNCNSTDRHDVHSCRKRNNREHRRSGAVHRPRRSGRCHGDSDQWRELFTTGHPHGFPARGTARSSGHVFGQCRDL